MATGLMTEVKRGGGDRILKEAARQRQLDNGCRISALATARYSRMGVEPEWEGILPVLLGR